MNSLDREELVFIGTLLDRVLWGVFFSLVLGVDVAHDHSIKAMPSHPR